MPNDECITCDNYYYFSCYACDIKICILCHKYLVIWGYIICSSYCMHEYIKWNTYAGNKYLHKHIHNNFDTITNKKEGHEQFHKLVNNQNDQLSLINVANKKRNCWT